VEIQAFIHTLQQERVIAVMRAMTEDKVMEAARALARGGIKIMEVAFSHPGAGEALRRLSSEPLPGILLGAGTVTSIDLLKQALASGAKFIVTPHIVPEVIEHCVTSGIPVVPGALTPTEIQKCVQMGAPAVKVFPARAMGPGYIRDLRGPYPDARLVPTGGVDSANAREFLAAGAIAVGAGGGLFRSMGASPERDIQANAEALLGALSEYRKA